MELLTRDFDIREFNEEARTVTGYAVTYGDTANVGGYQERIERGAFDGAEGVRLFYAHKEPIGLVTEARDTDQGYEITARISQTPRGEEVYTLLKDKVLTNFSIGFLPGEHRREGDVVVRTKVDLKEVSVVAFPAYSAATVSHVRGESDTSNNMEGNTMDENKYASQDELADVRGSVEDLERRLTVIGEAKPQGKQYKFRSGAALLKGLAAGDEDARREVRDFATTVDADVTRPGWVNEPLRLVVENNRAIANAVVRSPLPASGNSVEYPYVKTQTGDVAVQAAEGDNLAYLEVAVDTATAPVKTYGGYSSLSRQAIERSDMAYLETVLRFQALSYAKATNAAVASAIAANADAVTGTLTADTAGAWIDLVVNASAEVEQQTGLVPDLLIVGSAEYLRLAKMVDSTGRPLFNINGDGSNTVGNVNLKGSTAQVAGVPVIADWTNSVGSVLMNREAVTFYESPGAPFRLQDENIINLTKDFSLYGYAAVALTVPQGMAKLDTDLVA